jgi:hypothetical protein
MSWRSEYSPPSREHVRLVTQRGSAGEILEVFLEGTKDNCWVDLWELGHPTAHQRLDPRKRLLDEDLAVLFIDRLPGDERETDGRDGRRINEILQRHGYSPVHWIADLAPEYVDWLADQPKPSQPFVATTLGETVAILAVVAGQVVPIVETVEVELLNLTPRDLAAMRERGLKPLTVDQLAAAMTIPRRLAATVLHSLGSAVFLYDPTYWDHISCGSGRSARRSAPARRRETVADKIAAVLSDDPMTVAEIATAIGATNEAVLAALKRGAFQQTAERPARWLASSPKSQAP